MEAENVRSAALSTLRQEMTREILLETRRPIQLLAQANAHQTFVNWHIRRPAKENQTYNPAYPESNNVLSAAVIRKRVREHEQVLLLGRSQRGSKVEEHMPGACCACRGGTCDYAPKGEESALCVHNEV
ncbi:expressed unknown protein [Seminavis robusta]|uniref:Uncharacterized protein n=1 Tax=Seminavis robusta TaxID=568900 RepID=A0A9N8EPQ8_9STRA|nr:expressed unknown protein [Seminavis robusta]|eukprot:Sro1717_g293280.1 n/a (129) ;mRNA; f:22426-22812